MAAVIQGREPNLQAGADASKHGKEAVASLGTATNGARPTKADELKGKVRAHSLMRCTRSGEPERKMAKQRRRSGGSDLVRRARRN
ncbi:hypothetical protein PAHAL_J016800 [Panicum hallii]|uniref:Uncharacterized protein n=1 Tax=Panicum hallii TaxID=206008 RepID=A0A2T7A9Z5_9POAL|nr:hypothetical protein PAHAL_J016800 [Panicum hallii]